MINITLEAKEYQATGQYGSLIRLDIELRESELDTQEIAEHISIENFFETHNESELEAYCRENYDWFDKK